MNFRFFFISLQCVFSYLRFLISILVFYILFGGELFFGDRFFAAQAAAFFFGGKKKQSPIEAKYEKSEVME